MAVINKNRPKDFSDADIKKFNTRLATPGIKVPDMNALIYNTGVRVRLYKTLPCPNRKSIDGGEHQLDCPLCGGVELLDVDPIDTFASVTSIQKDTQFNPENIGATWEEQTLYLTFLSGIELLYFARIELLDYSMLFYQVIQRQEGLLDLAKYPVLSVNALIDQRGVRYYPGTDFTVDGRNLKWLTNPEAHRPQKGEIYSVHYNTYVTFRSLYAIHSNRFTVDGIKRTQFENIEYPQQWLCKKDYLVTREDMVGNKLKPNQIYPPGE